MVTVGGGILPSGYVGTWYVLTTSATQFTAYNGTTGLGNSTHAGTASIPQQVDADVYIILGGSSSGQNFTLQSSVGYTGQNIYIKNTNSNAWTVTPFGAETINGAANISVAAGATLVLQAVLVSPSTGGSNWISLQNS